MVYAILYEWNSVNSVLILSHEIINMHYVFCVCEGRYAELPKDVKNSISHRYRALAALSEHFNQLNDAPDTKHTKHQDWVSSQSLETGTGTFKCTNVYHKRFRIYSVLLVFKINALFINITVYWHLSLDLFLLWNQFSHTLYILCVFSCFFIFRDNFVLAVEGSQIL